MGIKQWPHRKLKAVEKRLVSAPSLPPNATPHTLQTPTPRPKTPAARGGICLGVADSGASTESGYGATGAPDRRAPLRQGRGHGPAVPVRQLNCNCPLVQYSLYRKGG
eukprot:3455262-Rhodomonas_salina.2